MKLSHVGQHMIFAALPLLELGGASTLCAADETAPRHWVDSHSHSHLHNGYRHGPAVYGWSYRTHGELPASWNGCGVYHYWNGEQCVDARGVAPNL